ncbi:MAG: hypothetical protein LCH73_06650 [Proteobacteria bacterium]|nr:hypothetical protein [Pseudomonadota bacterium]
MKPIALAAATLFATSLALAAQVAWSPPSLTLTEGPFMLSPRAGHQATALRSGQVLFTGGCAESGCDAVQRSAELFNPAGADAGRYAAAGRMHEARVSHTAALLPDGRVLLAGGWTGAATTATTEWYDPQTRQFSRAAPMSVPRMDGTATLLADGKVLIVGGAPQTNRPSATVDVFDPATNTMAAAAPLQTARAHHAAVRLPDGRVLVVGGLVGRAVATASAEIYDPQTGRFAPTGALSQPRCKLAALPLQDGRVMVLAGSTDCNERRRLASTEIYDPRTGVFGPGPVLRNPRYKVASAAAVLPSGAVLIAGDAQDVEVWRPGEAQFSALAGRLAAGLAFSTATLLPDGQLLIAGGYDEDIAPTAQSWRVAEAGLPAR